MGVGAAALSTIRQEEEVCLTLALNCLEPARPESLGGSDAALDEHLQQGERANFALITDHVVEGPRPNITTADKLDAA